MEVSLNPPERPHSRLPMGPCLRPHCIALSRSPKSVSPAHSTATAP